MLNSCSDSYISLNEAIEKWILEIYNDHSYWFGWMCIVYKYDYEYEWLNDFRPEILGLKLRL